MLFVIESDSFVMCLAGYKRIPYEAIHEFWKSLTWDHVPAAANNVSLNHGLEKDIENLTAYFRGLNSNGQAMVRRKVQAIYCPESSSLCSPEVRITSKRTPREKKSKPPRSEPIGSLKRIPSSWRQGRTWIHQRGRSFLQGSPGLKSTSHSFHPFSSHICKRWTTSIVMVNVVIDASLHYWGMHPVRKGGH